MAKIKPDPFLARPDGSRTKSAWLTQLQASADGVSQQARSKTGGMTFLPGNKQETNRNYIRRNFGYWETRGYLASWECLLQWHGESALADMEDVLENKDIKKLIATVQSDARQALFFRHLDLPEVRELVVDSARKWPLDTLQRLLSLSPRRGQPAADLIMRLVEANPDWLLRLKAFLAAPAPDDWLNNAPHRDPAQFAAQLKTLERLAATEDVEEASTDELPEILRHQPWKSRERPRLPVLEIVSQPVATLHWERWRGPDINTEVLQHVDDSEHDSCGQPEKTANFYKAQLASTIRHYLHRLDTDDSPIVILPVELRAWLASTNSQEQALFLLGVKPERVQAIAAGDTVHPDDFQRAPLDYQASFGYLRYLDDSLALTLLLTQPNWQYIYADTFASLLKRLGTKALALLFTTLRPNTQPEWQQLLDIIEYEPLACWLSQEGYKNRWVRIYALSWLEQYPACAARALIPLAFGSNEAASGHARHHLRWLARDHRQAIIEGAAHHGPQLAETVEEFLAIRPEDVLPEKLPALPKWLVYGSLPRLLLADSNHALPRQSLPDVLMCMALSKSGRHYAGLSLLQEALKADSLARFMLTLFEQWEANGSPPKDRWIFELQGPLGNDATARHLAPRIRKWRESLNRTRAYEGLEMLEQIGSDNALMLLGTFSQQKRFSDLQERANQAMENVARDRELTREQLADRIIPLLGLDTAGRCTLDFGPRQFTLGLNALLAPRVTDSNGKVLKDLPKPGTQDDAALAKSATDFYKDFKKQIKTIISTQPARLENAMCQQRRWRRGEFLDFFVHHPVMRHFSQRLLWAVSSPDGTWKNGFRVAEDATLADSDDALYALPPESEETALISLPHPLEIPTKDKMRWQTLFADYEIMQPFEQLARPTFVLPAEELARPDLLHYIDRRIGTGSLLGLEARGWKRQAGDGGMIESFDKLLTQDLCVSLTFDDGWFIAGTPPENESHRIRGIRLSPAARFAAPTTLPNLADLPAIMVSELIRDLEKMAWHTRNP